ncbi:MFS transporter [Actinoplanes sp. N902-109]|uniref:MFS transporter n=1 Tax=Actinoplanes sp. (strain N902-109) TaxID=649831 RepID=UPI0005A30217|nr:MFS transporter [Actinoplanes sp. N902-109]
MTASPRTYLSGWAVTTLGTGIVFPLTAVYLHDHVGLPVPAVSLYFAVFAVAGLVANPFAGVAAGRYGPGRVVLVATGFQTLGPLVLAAAGPPAFGMVAALLSGAGTGIFYAVLTPLLIDLFGRDRLGRVLAGQNAVSAATVGVGALAGGVLAGWGGVAGYRLAFVLNGLSYAAYGLLLAVILRGRRIAAAEPADRPFAGVLTPFTDRGFRWLLLLQGLLVLLGFGQIESVTPLVLRESAGLGVSGIGVVLAVNSLAVIAFQAPLLRVVERIGHVRALQTAVGCWAASLVLLWGATVAGSGAGVVVAAGFALLVALGECLISPSLQPLVVELAPADRMTAYTAATSLLHSIGNLLAPAVCLPLFASFGFAAYLGFQVAGYALALLATVVLVTLSPARPAALLKGH